MSFTATPVSKALIIGLCTTSLLAAIASRQYLFNVPLSPHLLRDRQFWRLPLHHFAFTNSADVFIAAILLFYTSVPVERSFGSHKYASFLIVTTGVITLLESIALLLGSRIGFTTIPAGPFGLSFAIMYQYSRVIPSTYYWKMFGQEISSRAGLYLLALQLISSQSPASIIVSILGMFAAYLYRSNVLSLQSYRVSPLLLSLSKRFLAPLLGDGVVPRRSNAAAHGELPATSALGALSTTAFGPTTPRNRPAPPSNTGTPPRGQLRSRNPPVPTPVAPGLVSQWTQGITGGSSSNRQPSDDEIASLSSMFPDQPRSSIITALSRSEFDLSRAAEYLLSLAS